MSDNIMFPFVIYGVREEDIAKQVFLSMADFDVMKLPFLVAWTSVASSWTRLRRRTQRMMLGTLPLTWLQEGDTLTLFDFGAESKLDIKIHVVEKNLKRGNAR